MEYLIKLVENNRKWEIEIIIFKHWFVNLYIYYIVSWISLIYYNILEQTQLFTLYGFWGFGVLGFWELQGTDAEPRARMQRRGHTGRAHYKPANTNVRRDGVI